MKPDEVIYVKKLQELLYQSIRELDYVQSVENCNSGLCATSLGKDLVEKGLKLLAIKDLSKETLYSDKEPRYMSERFDSYDRDDA